MTAREMAAELWRRDAERCHDPYAIGARRPSELRVGELVRYYPVAGGTDFVDTKVSSDPWQTDAGTWIVKLEGKSGGVSTQHLAPRKVGLECTHCGDDAIESSTGLSSTTHSSSSSKDACVPVSLKVLMASSSGSICP